MHDLERKSQKGWQGGERGIEHGNEHEPTLSPHVKLNVFSVWFCVEKQIQT